MKLTLKKSQNLSETLLQELGIRSFWEVGGKCGHYAVNGEDLANAIGIPDWQLTPKVGVYHNYLGGGIKGALIETEYHKVTNAKAAAIVENVIKWCRQRFEEIEAEMYDDDDAETNWEREATLAARNAGITSAY